jgi:ribosomal protein S18 acetylase RimI-like enzyme
MIRTPETPTEWDAYFQLRYEILRAPWGQPQGSEKTPDEGAHMHFAYFNAQQEIIGVVRLDSCGAQTGQIRFMAVAENAQGLGIGRLLMQHAEEKARDNQFKQMILHARANALEFYSKLGYQYLEKSHLLFGEIQHHLMSKDL